MQAGCFGCDVMIEAEDAESIADRFVAHARESHEWTYPDQALRNYAMNTAEAPVRLTGGTERLDEIGAVTVQRVTEDRIDDWLSFFDHDAFAGNPDWASCYCQTPHFSDPDEPELYWQETRKRMIDRIRGGTTFGYLAYVGGRPVGWVNASPRSTYAGSYRMVDPDGPDPASVIGVSCFVIAPPYRRHGLAAALLDQVVADAAARGAAWIEAYPFNERAHAESQHYFRGAKSLYEARGFQPIEVRERDTVVRRAV